MATNLTPTETVSADFSCGARIAAVAAGVTLVWRAIGAPPLGPILLGLSGLALIWHGMAPAPAVTEAASGPARRRARGDRDAVSRASEDSFPASDPPSWTPTNGPGRRH